MQITKIKKTKKIIIYRNFYVFLAFQKLWYWGCFIGFKGEKKKKKKGGTWVHETVSAILHEEFSVFLHLFTLFEFSLPSPAGTVCFRAMLVFPCSKAASTPPHQPTPP